MVAMTVPGDWYEQWANRYGAPAMARATVEALTCWIDWSKNPTPEQCEARDDLQALLTEALTTGKLRHHVAEIAAVVDAGPSFELWCSTDHRNLEDPRIP